MNVTITPYKRVYKATIVITVIAVVVALVLFAIMTYKNGCIYGVWWFALGPLLPLLISFFMDLSNSNRSVVIKDDEVCFYGTAAEDKIFGGIIDVLSIKRSEIKKIEVKKEGAGQDGSVMVLIVSTRDKSYRVIDDHVDVYTIKLALSDGVTQEEVYSCMEKNKMFWPIMVVIMDMVILSPFIFILFDK